MTGPVLLVDDDSLHRRMLATLLSRKLSLESLEAEHGRKALEILGSYPKGTIRLVLLDLNMPVMGGIETLESIVRDYPGLPVIMLTGSRDIEDAVRAMKAGAVDFITKPYESDRMRVTVENCLKISNLTREVSRLRRRESGVLVFSDLIGYDKGLATIVAMGRKAAASDIPVLVTGETGTGKELFSRAIHGESARAARPFVAVNCGAIPENLIESTLFGHEKGAFTGATAHAPGRFREADGGTIFLDEIGELPMEAQTRLLRVLQQKEVEPVGASRPVPVDVRIISATNRDLSKEVNAKRFREDLSFRLNALTIEIPPLRARREDIPALARRFAERFSRDCGVAPREIPNSVMEAISEMFWPGNVRELENSVYRAVVLSEGPQLETENFMVRAAEIEARARGLEGDPFDVDKTTFLRKNGLLKPLEEIERETISFALRHHGGNITEAARSLGMAKSTLYRKMPDLVPVPPPFPMDELRKTGRMHADDGED